MKTVSEIGILRGGFWKLSTLNTCPAKGNGANNLIPKFLERWASKVSFLVISTFNTIKNLLRIQYYQTTKSDFGGKIDAIFKYLPSQERLVWEFNSNIFGKIDFESFDPVNMGFWYQRNHHKNWMLQNIHFQFSWLLSVHSMYDVVLLH